jgi:hypothetical protein
MLIELPLAALTQADHEPFENLLADMLNNEQ